MSFNERLCPELYDYIIDFLHDDKPTIIACSLVCRSWLPRCRSHLFRDLVLSGESISPTTRPCFATRTSSQQVFTFFRSSPDLPFYIKRLVIHETHIPKLPTCRPVTEDILFPPLLQRLTSLRSLEFDYSTDIRLTWSSMTAKDVTQALYHLRQLTSLTLRNLCFQKYADLANLLMACGGLEVVRLDSVSFREFSKQVYKNPKKIQKTRLRELLLRSCQGDAILSMLMSAIWPNELFDLKSLTVTVTTRTRQAVSALLQLTPSLRRIDLQFSTIIAGPQDTTNGVIISGSYT